MLLIANSSKGLSHGTNNRLESEGAKLSFTITRLSGYILSISDFTPNKISSILAMSCTAFFTIITRLRVLKQAFCEVSQSCGLIVNVPKDCLYSRSRSFAQHDFASAIIVVITFYSCEALIKLEFRMRFLANIQYKVSVKSDNSVSF
jgi:hypothetical protein